MRSRIVTALAAVLLTVTAGVVAQSSGFPSRPQFAQVTVRTAGVGSTDVYINQLGAAANNRVVRLRNNGAGNFQMGAFNDALSTGNNFLSATFSGATPTIDTLNLTATNVQANGSAVVTSATIAPLLPKLSRGSVGVSGACTSSGVGMANGACTYVGAGIVTVSLAAAAYTSTPTCSVTLSGLGATGTSSIFIDSVSGSAPNYNLNVSIRKNGTGLADGNFFVLCLGA